MLFSLSVSLSLCLFLEACEQPLAQSVSVNRKMNFMQVIKEDSQHKNATVSVRILEKDSKLSMGKIARYVVNVGYMSTPLRKREKETEVHCIDDIETH